ncbi:MAG TPA: HD domain-containing phosphohydrolase [Actinomycetota bacterium]|nr:HD domain-containing phosphohydrolase [Actinomycetota bacterium]
MAKIAVSEGAVPIGAVMGLRELGHSTWLIPPGEPRETKRLVEEFPPDVAVLRAEVVDAGILAHLRDTRPQLRVLVVIGRSSRVTPLRDVALARREDDPIHWLRTIGELAPVEPVAEDSPVGIRHTLLRLIEQTQQAFDSIDRGSGDSQVGEVRRRLERSFEVSLRFLLDRLERELPGFAGHSSRVADLCRRIATQMGLPKDEVQTIVVAGLLGDLGLHLVAPSEALRRAGPLQPVEWESVHSHPVASANLIAPLSGNLSSAILDHHERIDGSGYPTGKSGDQISVAARIVAVADTYEALTHPRPHRPAMSPDDARDELRREARAGGLDPDVVEALVRALEVGTEEAGARQ